MLVNGGGKFGGASHAIEADPSTFQHGIELGTSCFEGRLSSAGEPNLNHVRVAVPIIGESFAGEIGRRRLHEWLGADSDHAPIAGDGADVQVHRTADAE